MIERRYAETLSYWTGDRWTRESLDAMNYQSLELAEAATASIPSRWRDGVKIVPIN